jgi:methionyl-tRNA formyltransferase
MSFKDLRIVFAGTPEFAAKHLEALIEADLNIVAVYSQPDRPSGRGKKLKASEVKEVALQHNIDVLQPESLKSEEAQSQLAALKPDLMIVVAYGLLLPKAVLDIPTFGCINVHGSILPKWRGAAPIQRAVLTGDSVTGVTIMQMDEGLDTGDMLHIEECEITPTDTSSSVYQKLQELGPIALVKVIPRIADKTINATKQDDNLATYAKKLSKEEAQIDWTETAEEIERKIRGYQPWPIAYCRVKDANVKVYQANILANDSGEAGEIISASKSGIVVGTATNQISISVLQPPGKKPMSAQDFLNGRADWFSIGSNLTAI